MQKLLNVTYSETIGLTIEEILEKDKSVVLFGQGITDSKSTFGLNPKTLSTHSNQRIYDIPIAEESITGIMLGASLAGLFPILTHLRMDFALLSLNQVINHYAKYSYMYGGQLKPSGLIRVIVGRSWGQGAQHAQNFAPALSHFPGIRVVLPATGQDIYEFYHLIAREKNGLTISIEHRNLFDLHFELNVNALNFPILKPPWTTTIKREGNQITIVATSIMVLETLRAADYLQSTFNISCEVISIGSTTEISSREILNSLKKTKQILICDIGWEKFGISAEIARLIADHEPFLLRNGINFVGLAFTPCPTSLKLEDFYYPNIRTICEKVLEILEHPYDSEDLPAGISFRDYYKIFRGPF